MWTLIILVAFLGLFLLLLVGSWRLERRWLREWASRRGLRTIEARPRSVLVSTINGTEYWVTCADSAGRERDFVIWVHPLAGVTRFERWPRSRKVVSL